MAKALTAISVEKLKPATGRREVPDALMPGLYLVIQPSGAKSWAVRYRHGRRPRKLTIGSYPAFDLAAARIEASAVLRAAATGDDPARQKQAAKAAAAFDNRDVFPAIARQFIARHARPNNKSWKEAARLLGLRPVRPGSETGTSSTPLVDRADEFTTIKDSLVDQWKDRPVRELTKRDVIAAIDRLVDAGKGTLANRTLSQLRKLFNWAVERDVLPSSPCNGLKAPSAEDTRDRVLTDDEVRWLWKACDSQAYPFGPLVKVLLLTGQRRAEAAGMMQCELNVRSATWSLPKHRTKNGEAHDVPLAEEVLGILKRVPKIAGAGFLFTNTGTTPVSGFSRAKARLDKAILKIAQRETANPHLLVEPWTLHDLRRTCASGMAAIDVPPHVVEAVLNHKSGTIKGVAAVYNRHQYAKEKRLALDAWARRVGEIVAGDRKVVAFRTRS